MNAENFMEYLAQPAKLYQLPYQEIKNLVAEYPYSANLRQLLLLKSKIEDDPKFEQHLHQLAAHTIDRDRLFSFVHEKIPQLLDLDTEPDDKLELKDLTQLTEEKEILLANNEETIKVGNRKSEIGNRQTADGRPKIEDGNEDFTSDVDLETEDHRITMEWTPANVHLDEVETLGEVGSGKSDIGNDDLNTSDLLLPTSDFKNSDFPLPTSDFVIPASLLHTLIAGSLLRGEELAPRAKEQFTSWRTQSGRGNRFQRLRRRAENGPATAPAPKKAKQRAKRSVQDQTNLASETLAKLLTRQGQYRKAIKIYERLSLLYPEKSRYFAATIEELKQKQQ